MRKTGVRIGMDVRTEAGVRTEADARIEADTRIETGVRMLIGPYGGLGECEGHYCGHCAKPIFQRAWECGC